MLESFADSFSAATPKAPHSAKPFLDREAAAFGSMMLDAQVLRHLFLSAQPITGVCITAGTRKTLVCDALLFRVDR